MNLKSVAWELILLKMIFDLFAFKAIASNRNFPENFKWCTATAAHQIEGNNIHSDWWAFEQLPGRIKNGEKSGLSSNHWNLVATDIDLMKNLGLRSYRFSIEWAKVEPSPNEFNEKAIQHYADEVQSLVDAGIEPWITLHHFTFPKWVQDEGSWEWSGIEKALARFTRVVFERIAPQATTWITINEPLVHLMGGYYAGVVPPEQKRSFGELANVIRGILKAHRRMYHTLHALAESRGKKIRVGMAHHLRTIDPASAFNPLDHIVAAMMSQAFNWALPEALQSGWLKVGIFPELILNEKIEGLQNTQDFFGLNYYTGELVSLDFKKGLTRTYREDLPKTDMGWDIYPEGFYRILKEIDQRFPQMEIIITENGIADQKGDKRIPYLQSHLEQVLKAINEGVPITGYCYWSLIDNFEWNEGFHPRFGLFEVNYENFKRKARPAANFFRNLIQSNFLPAQTTSTP